MKWSESNSRLKTFLAFATLGLLAVGYLALRRENQRSLECALPPDYSYLIEPDAFEITESDYTSPTTMKMVSGGLTALRSETDDPSLLAGREVVIARIVHRMLSGAGIYHDIQHNYVEWATIAGQVNEAGISTVFANIPTINYAPLPDHPWPLCGAGPWVFTIWNRNLLLKDCKVRGQYERWSSTEATGLDDRAYNSGYCPIDPGSCAIDERLDPVASTQEAIQIVKAALSEAQSVGTDSPTEHALAALSPTAPETIVAVHLITLCYRPRAAEPAPKWWERGPLARNYDAPDWCAPYDWLFDAQRRRQDELNHP